MKTQTKILIALGMIVALCIGFLIGISIDFQGADSSKLAGSIGKADKYSNSPMTAKDIQLRSEIVKDTAQLFDMIQGLVYFSLFTEDLSHHIDSCVTVFNEAGMGNGQDAFKLQDLQQYSDFIRNNNQALQATIGMLFAFYSGEAADQSADVEQNLRDFASYVNRLSAMDSVLTASITDMDRYMLGKDFKESKEEIMQLKSIRDQLLIREVQLAGILCDKELGSRLLSYSLSSQDQFNALEGIEIEAIGSAQYNLLESFMNSQGQIGAEFSLSSTPELGVFYSSDKIAFLLYDKDNIGLFVNGAEKLGSGQPLCYLGSNQLNVLCNNYSLSMIILSQSLGNLSMSSLNLLCKDNVNAVFQSMNGIESLNRLMANENLGVIIL